MNNPMRSKVHPGRLIRPQALVLLAFVAGCGSVTPDAVKDTTDAMTSGSDSSATTGAGGAPQGHDGAATNSPDTSGGSLAEASVTTAEASVDSMAEIVDAAVSDSKDAAVVAPADVQIHVPACPAGMAMIKGGPYTSPNSGTLMTIADFCLDVTEVTAGAFKACVAAGICDTAGVNVVADARCFYGKTDKDSYPMNCMGTVAAVAYCSKNAKRLPSEVEWEWAARGGLFANIYPWGTDAPVAASPKLCWSLDANAGACATRAHPTGSTAAGVYDMAGNVAEVVSTAFDAMNQVVKGGAYVDTLPANVSVVARSAFYYADANPVVGFRCAVAPQ